jgi:pentose-5-phosphate-3-epimerase
VTVSPRAPNPALLATVARHPGVVLAGSIYAVMAPGRLAVAEFLADAELWIHADVIVDNDAHRGVDLPLIRTLVGRRLGPVDVHLIASDLDGLLDEVCRERVDRITFPFEACDDVGAVADQIRASGAVPWVAVAPETDLAVVRPHLPAVDGVLVMLIQPGSSDAADPRLKAKVDSAAPLTTVGVDGGVNEANLSGYLHAGARYIVSGRALFTDGLTDAELRKGI